ncbi:helix-turn-helix transcriptional regulator [Phyllobacterium sp. BT25]|uniref:Helix-turn-helix transcriptional regulator n=2 Tax=Phyllobacterium pellucidum TaxID=2740464 RepID=A0A849VTL3_9HYPH|nr:helix-turn-helix transcriptional regulator [Phyllobacterium pellucidum]
MHHDLIDQELGQKLKALRLAGGMSQQRLGGAIGVSATQIQKYERGANRISVSTLIALCHALKRDPMALLGRYFDDNAHTIEGPERQVEPCFNVPTPRK